MVGPGGDCPDEHTVAFVGGAALAARGAACATADVVALTGYAAPKRAISAWTDADDVLTFPSLAALQTVPVRVWMLENSELFVEAGLGPTEAAALLAARAQRVDDAIAVANGVFLASRVGIRVDRLGAPITLLSSATNCGELLNEIALDGDLSGNSGAPDLWDPAAINVYVMDAFTDARGEYCLPAVTGGPRNVIRLQPTALPSTLVHEIGHLAGLYVPWGQNARYAGHVDAINAFTKDNVMWGRLNLGTTAARTRLSLGQVYRMHFDKRSALVPGASTDCGCDPYGATCGYLSRDVRPLANARGKLPGSAAYCEAP
jgi:hypothetical protein